MAFLIPHNHAPGLSSIVQRLESFIFKCQQTIQTLTSSCNALSSGDPTCMLRGFCAAEDVLAHLQEQAADTREKIARLHQTTPYPRFIDSIPEDILSYIFCLVVAESSPDDDPVMDKYQREDTHLRCPERIIQVNRRWRHIALGTALLWTRIIADGRHSLKRTVRWLTLSQRAPLSVLWRRHTKELPVLASHISRIESLNLMVKSAALKVLTSSLLIPLAPSGMLKSLSLFWEDDYDYEIIDVDDDYITLPLTPAVAEALFSSIRHFELDSVLLPQPLPLRNLLSLRLAHLRLEWRMVQGILASSPYLQSLALCRLAFSDQLPDSRDHTLANLPVYHHLRELEIFHLMFSGINLSAHCPWSVLHAIAAPSLVRLVVHGEWYPSEAVNNVVSAAGSSLEEVDISMRGVVELNGPKLDNIVSALVDGQADPYPSSLLPLRSLTISHMVRQDRILSDPHIAALGRRCRSLVSLKLCGMSFSPEALLAMVQDRNGVSEGDNQRNIGLAFLQTTLRFNGDAVRELKGLGVVVVDGLPPDAKEWEAEST